MGLYSRLLGTPFVYERVRPLVVGGLDLSPFYGRLGDSRGAAILDIGCGTGDAFNYVRGFERYLGVDTDPVAIDFARRKHGDRPGVSFDCREIGPAEIRAFAPSHVIMAGLLHHLPDEVAVGLLEATRAAPGLQRVLTLDIVFLDGYPISNLLARLDRGRHSRRREAYEALAERAGFRVEESVITRSHPRTGLAYYLIMTLTPGAARGDG
jgi:SAM-dependent methyltransferase